ncbi:MAG: VWA domain-containing protein [Betaproteobacteria bacterium]|nr:VWA domain-containing protein [Betaproteobacteria bacterium]MDE2122815.1 VWA domain-containing protein [Betaproteobacteria bacterium]MDE2186482.1 VWA domain-containing protein [Betaproteobacteria bacterium]MDE2324439.1 VWA domain-containing protein [Betaproteobacteria bacterium]
MQLGDARHGKFADNLAGFGRALRRAGVRTDSARIALAGQAAVLVGVDQRIDLGAALETVLVSREQDRLVFRELFDAFFRDPKVASRLLAQLLPSAEGRAEPSKRHPRVREALAPRQPPAAQRPSADDQVNIDAFMTASAAQRLRHADFNALGGQEYRLVERLARDIPLPIPCLPSRRTEPDCRGFRAHWPGVMRSAARTGGEWMELPRLRRRRQPLPLLVVVDVSGSMERYIRLLLAFLHASTRTLRQRDVFAFGTRLTDLTVAFRHADTDIMLADVNTRIADFAGGTQLGASLSALRLAHSRRLVGHRTLVLLISDGLDTGEPAVLDAELAWLLRRCRRLLWLNPLLRFDGYEPSARGAAALHRRAHAMLAVHNLVSLEQLASSLATLIRQH